MKKARGNNHFTYSVSYLQTIACFLSSIFFFREVLGLYEIYQSVCRVRIYALWPHLQFPLSLIFYITVVHLLKLMKYDSIIIN